MGTHYYLFLLAAWFAALETQLLKRSRLRDDVLIFDGWYYRVAVKAELRSQLSEEWIDTLFRNVDEPDMVVLLDIDPATAWRRRTSFSPSELGRWDGLIGDDRSNFCTYQGRIRERLLSLAGKKKWLVLRQTDHSTPETMVEEIISALSRALEDERHRCIKR
jgi:thymidylate kinase